MIVIKLSQKLSKMNTISKGSKIISKKMTMVVTGSTDTAYLGYIEYKGKSVGQCSILKEMFTNPHYMNDIEVVN